MLKKYRLLRGYTQQEVADLLKRDIRTIQRMEKEEIQPTLENLRKLIKILKISDKDIIDYIKKD